jgi:hypothetical protein
MRAVGESEQNVIASALDLSIVAATFEGRYSDKFDTGNISPVRDLRDHLRL